MVNHTNGRTNSYFNLCEKQYKLHERKEYLNLVPKEYVFDEDRQLNIVENNLKVV
jgi:hypothetical protein